MGMLDLSAPDNPPDLAHNLAIDLVFYITSCCTSAMLCALFGEFSKAESHHQMLILAQAVE
jgi:hypothetical protein